MINQKNLSRLAWKLVKHPALYDQNLYFNARTHCGTVGCLAGHSTLLSGVRVKDAKTFGPSEYREVASKFLGIIDKDNNSRWSRPQIFMGINDWPSDLSKVYYNTNPYVNVLAALYALQRMEEDGAISPDPNKVLNPLPEQIAYIQDLYTKFNTKGKNESTTSTTEPS
jgi:hypothetical protein